MMNMTPVVKQLLIINILFFIGSQLVLPANDLFALFTLQSNKFQLWQPITHMFMHGSIMHIAFNMFALYSFGSSLEHFWGGKKFLFFYISCGLGAAALHLGINYLQLQEILKGAADLNLSHDTLLQILNVNFSDSIHYRGDLFGQEVQPILERAGKVSLVTQQNLQALFEAAINVQTPMVGASGAIYGLLVAFAYMFPNAELMMIFLPIPIKAKYFVPGIIAIDLILALGGNSLFGGGDGIAHFAHIGGALVGFLMMWYWKKSQFDGKRWN
jgi:membrane associated rhomboid family serine protease